MESPYFVGKKYSDVNANERTVHDASTVEFPILSWRNCILIEEKQ